MYVPVWRVTYVLRKLMMLSCLDVKLIYSFKYYTSVFLRHLSVLREYCLKTDFIYIYIKTKKKGLLIHSTDRTTPANRGSEPISTLDSAS